VKLNEENKNKRRKRKLEGRVKEHKKNEKKR